MLAGVEGGGTSWKVALATPDPSTPGLFTIVDTQKFVTTTPAETLGKIHAHLHANRERITAVGIASFGPVDLDRASPTYGFITTTPKPGWKNSDVRGIVMGVGTPTALDLPCGFDTDVNAPAMSEFFAAGLAAQGKSSCAYITLGTGCGVGLVVNGQCVSGLLHPEGGHISVPRHPKDAGFNEVRNLRGDSATARVDWCEAESMACKPALEARLRAMMASSRAGSS
jgi:fructokinase